MTGIDASEGLRGQVASASGSLREQVAEVLYRGCLLLDEGKFAAWLSLCTEDFRYRIEAYSPEIRREMTWMEQDHRGMQQLIEMLPKHNTDHGRLSRLVSLYTVSGDHTSPVVSAVSVFACYRTSLDGADSHLEAGESRLFVVGKYHDIFARVSGAFRLRERTVRLETRRLDRGSHYPL